MLQNPELHYLDNAATTRLSPGALAAMLPFLAMEGGNPSGSHRFAREAKKDTGIQ